MYRDPLSKDAATIQNSRKTNDFPTSFSWINTSKPLSIVNDLKGYVVVLDFWTYCCINCMHTLPTLGWLEKKYRGQPVVFIGVHSAKFSNEEHAENVQEAVGRYEITHPVIVDQGMKIWRSFDVTAWPTIVIIDPKGNVVYHQAGEGQRDELDDVLSVLLEQHRELGSLAKGPFIDQGEKPMQMQMGSSLSYPGKIALSPDGKILAISDSNHNRVILVDTLTGKILYQIGGKAASLYDGTFEHACFFRPQGVTWAPSMDKLYVADTENHALREIDLHQGIVKTLAGNGSQGHWIFGAHVGRDVKLSSPWDLVYSDEGFLFIAMAGLHQIWVYHIESGKIGPFAGSGYEGIADGSFAESQFAQPSGISAYGKYLIVADSETSAIRALDLDRKTVQTIVGNGLFDFGHRDGPLGQARFQHPLGIHCVGNKIYVADTYNSAIRIIDLDSQLASTLIGSDVRKNSSKSDNPNKVGQNLTIDAAAVSECRLDDPACGLLSLYEPSDVKQNVGTSMLYIADTNNHLVRTFDLQDKVLGILRVKDRDADGV